MPPPVLRIDRHLHLRGEHGRPEVVFEHAPEIAPAGLEVDGLAQDEPQPDLAVVLALEEIANDCGRLDPGRAADGVRIIAGVVVVGGDLADGRWFVHA